MSPAVQILAVGAAAPAGGSPRPMSARRGAAVAAGRPRSARPTRTSSPSPPRPPGGPSRPPASRPTSSTGCGGAPPARRSPRARATPCWPRPSASPTGRAGALCSGSPHSGMEALLGAADAIGAGSARVALVVASDALVPGPGHALRGARRRGRRRVRARVVRRRRVARRTRHAHAPVPRPLPRRPRDDDARPLRPAALPRGDLPPDDARARRAARRARRRAHLVAPRPRRSARSDRREAARRPRRPRRRAVYAALGDTGAAAALLGGIGALAEPGTVAIVGFGGGRATGVEITVKDAVAGCGRGRRRRSNGGRQVTYAEVLRARRPARALGRDRADGRAARERAVRARRRRDARPARRTLRRLRHDQHASVDPPALHRCGSSKFVLEALARRGRVHTFVVNQTMPAPFVAPLPLASSTSRTARA